MKLTETIKGFLKMTGHFSGSAVYLAEHGYNEEYMRMLGEETESAKNPKEKAEGMGLQAQAMMFRGELEKAAELYEQVEIKKLPKHMDHVFVNNFIMCLFLLNRFGRIDEIYREYNSTALSESSLVMRRTIGIREFIEKRFENAVTVFIKLVEEPDPRATLMADICLVRAMLALDMNERAREIADLGFSRYGGKGGITAEVNKLTMKMNAHGGEKNNKNRSKKRRK